MTIVDMLRANAEKYPNEVALVEVNPERRENRHITWRDYDLVETTDELTDALSAYSAGDTVELQVARKGQLFTVQVTLGEKSAS